MTAIGKDKLLSSESEYFNQDLLFDVNYAYFMSLRI